MRFGFFDQLPCPEGFSESQRYDDFMAQIELGDQLGFDTVWLGELHFSRKFSIMHRQQQDARVQTQAGCLRSNPAKERDLMKILQRVGTVMRPPW
ncbi:LLM class flavin-dependent oxidoreductase [Candidatus Entotheonella palauensis]|uniref:LLM class flavin-dependent oxidoreductase n=1 Tax=Candidatus Entotheonella palauensis TaxID=93172 RepID=UPI001178406F|nr:LLM class flavin-dependent oxidoreductase [Candidatus Entotheonella palauensis]